MSFKDIIVATDIPDACVSSVFSGTNKPVLRRRGADG